MDAVRLQECVEIRDREIQRKYWENFIRKEARLIELSRGALDCLIWPCGIPVLMPARICTVDS